MSKWSHLIVTGSLFSSSLSLFLLMWSQSVFVLSSHWSVSFISVCDMFHLAIEVLLLCLVCVSVSPCCTFLSVVISLFLHPSIALASPPLTFQCDPLLPPDKASIVSQMLFNMEPFSEWPSYGATHYTLCFVCNNVSNKTLISLINAFDMHTHTRTHAGYKSLYLSVSL